MFREGKKCIIYKRVSTEMQIDGYSLEGQQNVLQNFAQREGMIVVGTYEDAGKSGKSIEGREQFKKMLSDIKSGMDVDYVIVYKLSRFGRNVVDILNSLELIEDYGVHLICVEDGIDSSQASGKLLITILSSVAEIERENIIEQTMNGRREKAREGGWNGGFAPYGYKLENNHLIIEEAEAPAIRLIFDKYVNTEMGYNGVAKYLNEQCIKKIPRHNGKTTEWSGHLVRMIIDNPVYAGNIAFGRRKKEKVQGTRNGYHHVPSDDFIISTGKHDAIVSQELWDKAHEKRQRTGHKYPSKVGRDRIHLLTGLLKCSVCGNPMYTNKHAWTKKDGTYKEVYYYCCSRNKLVRGNKCEYNANLRKTDIEPAVIEAIRQLVTNETFAVEIKKRIGKQIDTSELDIEIENYRKKLCEVNINKSRLENEIDTMPADEPHRDRKIRDMSVRLNSLYDVIIDIEQRIEDAYRRRKGVEMNALTLENIYKLLLQFDKIYDIISDEDKKRLISSLVSEIQIFRNDEPHSFPIKSMTFNFPVMYNGNEVNQLVWENDTTLETVILLSRKIPDDVIHVDLDLDELDITSVESKATYKEIKDYVLKNFDLTVTNLNIAQVKRKLGIIERENYNLPKSDKSKQPNCTAEKEKAIKAALRHFGMV